VPPDPPANTNQDGPDPVLPAWWWTPPIAPTGMAFCDGCGLGETVEGTLLMGDYNDGGIHRLTLTEDRTGVVADDVVYTNLGGVLGMRAGPDGAIYFSDFTGIWRLELS
jgi:glucose/arabinose dehydrogenase